MGLNITLTLENNFETDLENLKNYLLIKYNRKIDNKCAELMLKILSYSNLVNGMVNDEIILDLIRLTSLSSIPTGQQVDKTKNSKDKKHTNHPRNIQLIINEDNEKCETNKDIKAGQYRVKPVNNRDIIGKVLSANAKNNNDNKDSAYNSGEDNCIYDLHNILQQFLGQE